MACLTVRTVVFSAAAVAQTRLSMCGQGDGLSTRFISRFDCATMESVLGSLCDVVSCQH